MISLLSALHSGNAVSVLLNPPSNAKKWRVIRKTTDTITSQNDSLLVYEGTEKFFIDRAALDNGVEVFYKPFYLVNNAWVGYPSASVTPGQTFVTRSADAQGLIRDRLDAGLNEMITRNLISHPDGIIPVYVASPRFEDAQFPLVTVHQTSTSSDVRGIGEDMANDQWGETTVDTYDGWYDDVSIDIVLWCLNGDQRKQIRDAIKHLIVSNLAIFHDAGLLNISLQFSDRDDFESYDSPMYTSSGLFKCLAPVVVTGDSAFIINEVESQAVIINNSTTG